MTDSTNSAEPNKAILQSAVRRMTLPDLVEASDVVIMGIVRGTAPGGVTHLPGTDFPVPYREIWLKVEQYLTRRLTFDELKVRMLGGALPDVVVDVPEEPTFGLGEHVLVFLCKDTGNMFELPDDTFTVQGLFQGKYSIIRDQDQDFAVGHEGRTTEPLVDLRREIARISQTPPNL
jgi:hypothetical protein